MNCEHVEDRLSAYLDNVLTAGERREIAIHLQACPKCMMLLAELRQNDILLAQLPRINPHPVLQERIFSSPEYLELTGTSDNRFLLADEWTRPLNPGRIDGERPLLVALPGGRSSSPMEAMKSQTASPQLHPRSISPKTVGKHHRKIVFKIWPLASAAVLVLLLGTLGLFGLMHARHTPAGTTNVAGAITPPAAAPGQTGPLAAGTRFVFLRDGKLWSTLVDGSSRQPEQLTPSGVSVAANWIVSPTPAGHIAGNLLTYIDLQGARVHTIRSDGQEDTVIQQALLKGGTVPGSVWETATGQTILNSLTWSNDGSLLAFVADPNGNGQTNLYLYSTETGEVQKVVLDVQGSVSHPTWSPDNTRLAFEVAHNGLVDILDYNVQSQGVLDLTNSTSAQGNSANSILTLGWSPGASAPAVTWSLGTVGQVSSIWIHRVGADGSVYPQLLLKGNYVQALYSQKGDNGPGSWLLIAAISGAAGDISRLDLTPGAHLVPLSQGRQVSFASWSPDGSSVFYLNTQTNGVGSGFIVNIATGVTYTIATSTALSPAPVWSTDSQQLAYSTGAQINIVNVQNGAQVVQLHLQGTPTSLSWSPTSGHQLVVALGDTAEGIYLVDTVQNTAQQLDRSGTNSQIQWTEIP
jgi:hypothetical protein